jgi:AmmeMemoRadiSam system protein A
MDVMLRPQARRSLLRLARGTLERHLGGLDPPAPPRDHPEFAEHRATFVTITRRANGELRGCRGEITPQHPLADSVMRMAIASATDDPRFPPVTHIELPELHLEISVLTPLERIDPRDVEVGRHGLYIRHAGRAGLLLPQVAPEYHWTRDEFLLHTCRKAGLRDDAWRNPDATLYGFECDVFGEASD